MKRCATKVSAALLLAALPAAQGRRLNAPLPPAIAGDVRSPLVVSPDGSHVVFLADAAEDERVELYSAPAAGGVPVKLNAPLVAGGDVTVDVLVTGDSARVVYRADQDEDEVFELYSVPIAGGAVTKLSGTLAPGADVAERMRVSASTGRVAYRVVGGGNPRLYSVPSAGGVSPTRLDAGAAFEEVQGMFAISNDGLGVAYRSDGLVDGRVDLWVAKLDGSLPPQLRSAAAGGDSVIDFAFAPGDTHLVYRATNDSLFGADLYSVPVVGGAPTRLNSTLPPGGRVEVYAVSSGGGARVVYSTEVGQQGGLYSVAIDGGAVTELATSRVWGLAIGGASPTPRVIYHTDADANGRADLHTIPIEGGASFQFTFPNTDVWSFRITPDATRVILGTINWLYSAPIEGGALVSLNSVAFNGMPVDFEIAPDSASVLYVAGMASSGVRELWSAPVVGGGSTRLNAELAFEGDVDSALLASSGARAVYIADQDTDGANELYSVASAGGPTTKLSPPLVTLAPEGDVRAAFRLRPDGGRAVYLADQDLDEVDELWTVSTEGGAPTRLNAFAPASDVTAFDVSPDWSRAVYLADRFEDEAFRIFSAPLDGSAVVALDAGPVLGGDVESFAISPDSSRVVYRADQDFGEKFELYSVPIGGGAIVKLNAPLVSGLNVLETFRIAPDSSRVVYLADQVVNEQFELWSVRLAGGGAVRLSAPLAPGGDVTAVEIAADSSRVVYLADQDQDERFELWSVPLAGGTPMRLNATLPNGGDVSTFGLAPDSSRAVYRADQDQNDVHELFSVPLAGGSATRLNGPMTSGGDLEAGAFAFGISADSNRVLYRADEAVDSVVELWGVPIAGGTSMRLNPPLPAGRNVTDFRIAPDSSRAAYRADQDTDDALELYAVTFATGTITRLHAPRTDGANTSGRYLVTPDSAYVVVASDLVVPTDVRLYALPFSGAGVRSLSGPLDGDNVRSFDVRNGRAVYVADQAINSVFELFVAILPRPMRDGSVPSGQ